MTRQDAQKANLDQLRQVLGEDAFFDEARAILRYDFSNAITTYQMLTGCTEREALFTAHHVILSIINEKLSKEA